LKLTPIHFTSALVLFNVTSVQAGKVQKRTHRGSRRDLYIGFTDKTIAMKTEEP
jgi:hypothetical protein